MADTGGSGRFLDALRSGRVLLMDGAMGTELIRAGLRPGECAEAWNLSHPERVRAVHAAYVEVGAEVLVTNTFQANPLAMEASSFRNQLRAVCEAGVEQARFVKPAFVLGSIGPFLGRPRAIDSDRGVGRQVVRGLLHADALLLETWTGLDALHVAAFLQSAPYGYRIAPPTLLSWSFERTRTGRVRTHGKLAPERLARFASKFGIAAIGVNCGRDIGINDTVQIVRRFRDATDLPLFARPNAGTPTRQGDGWRYTQTPSVMCERLHELLEAGVAMIGGCCGTTPAHIAAFRPIIDSWNAKTGANA